MSGSQVKVWAGVLAELLEQAAAQYLSLMDGDGRWVEDLTGRLEELEHEDNGPHLFRRARNGVSEILAWSPWLLISIGVIARVVCYTGVLAVLSLA